MLKLLAKITGPDQCGFLLKEDLDRLLELYPERPLLLRFNGDRIVVPAREARETMDRLSQDLNWGHLRDVSLPVSDPIWNEVRKTA